MLRTRLLLTILLLVLSLAGCSPDPDDKGASDGEQAAESREGTDISLSLKPGQLDWVGQKIFENECASRYDCLVHWNPGEAFPSLGIGHFIWYPEGVDGPYVESFPALIRYMAQRQVAVPEWLRQLEPFEAPWPDRETFLEARDSVAVAELREFLAGTQGLQAEFMFRRAQQSLERVLASAPADRRDDVSRYLRELSSTPGGLYALIDYVNFKGEGLSEKERYRGHGWGLLQVLLAMEPGPGQTALGAFREAAARVLTLRAERADRAIEREQWLPGWLKRLDSYREPTPSPVGGCRQARLNSKS